MGRLSRKLEEKLRRLLAAARRGAFESYVRHGRVPEAYERIAAVVSEAKALNTDVSLEALGPGRPAGRPTTHYVWRTAGDGRVRGSHAARNGQIFAWADPPEHGHPGQEPNCRCWPEPYYGDPAVPDALLQLLPERRVNTDPGVLWASIETLTRPDGSLAASDVVMNDGTTIQSSFAGSNISQVVALPDSSFYQSDRMDQAHEISAGRDGETTLEVAWLRRTLTPVFLPPPPTSQATPSISTPLFPGEPSPLDSAISPVAIMLRGALALHNAAMASPEAMGSGPADLQVVAFRVWQGTGADGNAVVTHEALSAEQVAQLCPRLPEVQEWTDTAVSALASQRSTMTPQDWGTAVHSYINHWIKALKATLPLGYGDIDSELSIDRSGSISTDEGGPRYAQRGTIRSDIVERASTSTTCFYDVKTGDRGMEFSRVEEAFRRYGNRSPGGLFIFIEMRAKP